MTQQEQLNKIDRKILSILQEDARISFAELARQVGLTTTPCIERVKRLQRAGYIKGYQAILNPDMLDASLLVFVQIRLDRTSKENFDEFYDQVMRLKQVQSCYLVTGSFDFLIQARVGDMAAYRAFLGDSLLSLPGVQESTSVVVMEAYRESLQVPISGI
ncbi:MAG: Lrp/AsnC ligand binding domain-containing protein [Gammaproteobacteria bacterium]